MKSLFLCACTCRLLTTDLAVNMSSYVIGVVLGGTTALVGAPFIVTGLGFTAAGIAAGSTAASMMSVMGPTVAGGVVATLQSVGAAGLGVAASTAVTGAGGAIGAVVAKALGG